MTRFFVESVGYLSEDCPSCNSDFVFPIADMKTENGKFVQYRCAECGKEYGIYYEIIYQAYEVVDKNNKIIDKL